MFRSTRVFSCRFFNTDFDDQDWDKIVVPGNWQLQGYGKMHYSDLQV